MAREALERSGQLQVDANWRGGDVLAAFSSAMRDHLVGTGMYAEIGPVDLRGIYGTRVTPDGRVVPHGIIPSFGIYNSHYGKMVFVSTKIQQPYGAAHERSCKFMMPGILRGISEGCESTGGGRSVLVCVRGRNCRGPLSPPSDFILVPGHGAQSSSLAQYRLSTPGGESLRRTYQTDA